MIQPPGATGEGPRIRFEDVLRALGHDLDRMRFVDVVIREVPEGLQVDGHAIVVDPDGRFAATPRSLLLSHAEMEHLLEAARRRRARPEPPATAPDGSARPRRRAPADLRRERERLLGGG